MSIHTVIYVDVVFFFQAEDGIRDVAVTGVQTCALPISVQQLAARDWPGTIRELRNAIERLLILATGPAVTAQDVERIAGLGTGDAGRGTSPTDLAGAPWMRATTFEEFKQVAERTYILAKLKEHDWNVSETARTLDMPRSNLYKKIERYGLAREA